MGRGDGTVSTGVWYPWEQREATVPRVLGWVPATMPLLLALLLLLALPATAAAQTVENPVIEGDRPDPTVMEFEGRFYAASTSGDWAPLFPIVRSDDLANWEDIGAVLQTPPSWGAGRFWAPELVRGPDGGVLAYWSSSSRGGRPCLGVASAPRPEGPWTDRGKVACPPGGAIDVAPVIDEAGRRWLGWKRLGVGGGLHVQRLSPDGLRARGPAPELIRPDRSWERGVTEGASWVRRDGWWYLFYSGGNCCRPPCTYAEGVARSRTLTGPYAKFGPPIMRGSAASGFRCPGHGTTLQLADGSTWLLHHGYRYADTASHRRLMLLSELRFPDGRWPVTDGPRATVRSPLGAMSGPRADRWHEAFEQRGRRLAPGWQWLWNRRPRHEVRDGALRITCRSTPRRPDFVARQAPGDRFAATATLRPARGTTAFLALYDHAKTLRGVARDDDGRTFTFRVTAGGEVTRGRTQRGRGRLATVLGTPAGDVGAFAGGRPVPGSHTDGGAQPTRVAIGCWGRGTTRTTAVALRPRAPAGG